MSSQLPITKINAAAVARILARRLAARQGISLELAQQLADRQVRAAADRRAAAEPRAPQTPAPDAPVTLSTPALARAIAAKLGITLERAQQLAERAAARRMPDAEPGPTSGPFEDDLMEKTAQQLATEEGADVEEMRAHVARAFPSRAKRRKALSAGTAPSLSPSHAPASPTQNPTGAPMSDAPAVKVDGRRLARQIARQKGITLELAQQLADRQMRAARRGGK